MGLLHESFPHVVPSADGGAQLDPRLAGAIPLRHAPYVYAIPDSGGHHVHYWNDRIGQFVNGPSNYIGSFPYLKALYGAGVPPGSAADAFYHTVMPW